MSVLHHPPGERKVDIIFVHGLGGSSRSTWAKKGDLEKCWPLRFLPKEPGINEARILTFGYKSKFKRGAGKNQLSILDFAKSLLFALKHARNDSTDNVEGLDLGGVSTLVLPLEQN